jgi:hypothetical protein
MIGGKMKDLQRKWELQEIEEKEQREFEFETQIKPILEDYIKLINKENTDNCICKSTLNKLKNLHNNNRNIDLILHLKKDDEGIVVFENNTAIACFDINYCPMCGRKL